MSEPIIEVLIDVTELIQLADSLPHLSSFIYDEMRKAMDETGQLLTVAVSARTPVNYGLLRSSIQWPEGYEMEDDTFDRLRGIVGASDMESVVGISTSTYVDYVEEDTSAHWALIAPLKLYAIRKWGDENAAYGLQRKIAAKGTTGKHMFKEGWEASQGKVEEIWNRIPAKVVDQFERLVQ